MFKSISNLIKIFVLVAIAVFFYKKEFNLFGEDFFSKNISEFISIQGSDEYIVTTLNTAESSQEERKRRILGKVIPGTKSTAILDIQAVYKYYVKLTELTYTLKDNTIEFSVPAIYLSKPVGYNSPSFKCDDSIFSDCDKINKKLIEQLPLVLETKGVSKFSNIYDTADKAIADNFYAFAKKNDKIIKNISIKFGSEDSSSLRSFNYD